MVDIISLCCLHNVQRTSALQTPSSVQTLVKICVCVLHSGHAASTVMVYIPSRLENLVVSALEKIVGEMKQLLPAALPGKVHTMTAELIAEGLTDSSP